MYVIHVVVYANLCYICMTDIHVREKGANLSSFYIALGKL